MENLSNTTENVEKNNMSDNKTDIIKNDYNYYSTTPKTTPPSNLSTQPRLSSATASSPIKHAAMKRLQKIILLWYE